MKTLLQEIERNVDRELEVQIQIQSLLDRQLNILLNGRSSDLKDILGEAEMAMKVGNDLEKEREVLLNKAALELGLEMREVTLDRIETALGQTFPEIREKGNELKEIIERIRENNRVVSLLLRHSLLFIEDLVAAVTGKPREKLETYTPAGEREAKAAQTIAVQG